MLTRASLFIWAFLTLPMMIMIVWESFERPREREGWTQVTTAWPPGERKNWQKWRLMNIPGIKPESPHSSQGELEGGRNWFLVQNCSFRCKSKLLSMPLSIKVRTDNWSDASSLPVCEVWVARIKLVPCIRILSVPETDSPSFQFLLHGTDTANIFSPMCLVTGRGAHRERAESILRITNLRLRMMMSMMTRPGERPQTHSSLGPPGTEFQMRLTTATRIYWHFRECFRVEWINIDKLESKFKSSKCKVKSKMGTLHSGLGLSTGNNVNKSRGVVLWE